MSRGVLWSLGGWPRLLQPGWDKCGMRCPQTARGVGPEGRNWSRKRTWERGAVGQRSRDLLIGSSAQSADRFLDNAIRGQEKRFRSSSARSRSKLPKNPFLPPPWVFGGMPAAPKGAGNFETNSASFQWRTRDHGKENRIKKEEGKASYKYVLNQTKCSDYTEEENKPKY